MENNKHRLEPIVSKTFQNWIREHGEEIDECKYPVSLFSVNIWLQ